MSESNPRSVAAFFREKQCLQGVTAIRSEFPTIKQSAISVEIQGTAARSNLREFGIAVGMYLGVVLVIAAVRYYKHCEHEAWKRRQWEEIEAAIYQHEITRFKKTFAERTNRKVAFSLYPLDAQPKKAVVQRLGDDKYFIYNYAKDQQWNKDNPIPQLSPSMHTTWIGDREVHVQGLYNCGCCGRCCWWRLALQDGLWTVIERSV
jgi:hypothetical protein